MADGALLTEGIHARLVSVATSRAHRQIVRTILQKWPVQAAALLNHSNSAVTETASPTPSTFWPSTHLRPHDGAALLDRAGAHLLARVWERPYESAKGTHQINLWWLLVAVAVGGVIWLVATPPGLSADGQRALAILAATAVLWASEAVPIPLTALGVCAAFSVTGVATGAAAFQGFSSPTVFFLLGALTLGVAFEKVGLHTRVAAAAVRALGDRPLALVLAVFAISFLLPFAIPYHAVTAMFVPVLGMMVIGTLGRRLQQNMGRLLFMTLAIGSGIGSMASLVGATRNPIALELLNHETGRSFGYLTWFVWTAPVVAPFALFAIGILWWTLGRHRVHGVRLAASANRLGGSEHPLRREEWMVLGVTVVAIAGWIALGHRVGLAVVSLSIPALLLATRSVNWYDLERGVPWSLLIYYGGALTIGEVFQETGVGSALARQVQLAVGQVTSGGDLFGLAAGGAVAVALFSQVIGNAAVVATLLPVGLKLGTDLNIAAPATTTLIVLASALSFGLPVASPVNLLVYARPEVRKRDFLVVGGLVTLAGLATLCAVSALLWRIGYWS